MTSTFFLVLVVVLLLVYGAVTTYISYQRSTDLRNYERRLRYMESQRRRWKEQYFESKYGYRSQPDWIDDEPDVFEESGRVTFTNPPENIGDEEEE